MSTLERTQVYLPTKLKKRLKQEARLRNGTFSQVLREDLEALYNKNDTKPKLNAAAILLRGALQAEQNAKKYGRQDRVKLNNDHDDILYGRGWKGGRV